MQESQHSDDVGEIFSCYLAVLVASMAWLLEIHAVL